MTTLRLAARDGVPVLPSGRPDIEYCLAMGWGRFAQTTEEPCLEPSRAMTNLEAMTRDDLGALYDHVAASRPASGDRTGDVANARSWLETNHPEFFAPASPGGRP